MDRLSYPAKIEAFHLSEEIKKIMTPLFQKHMDDIMTGEFSKTMMIDWEAGDYNLLKWRAETGETAFEKTEPTTKEIPEQEYFDNGLLLVAFVKAGVELAFETMTDAGIKDASAYYESLHEAPLIANTIARKKLFEMNRIISDTAEYGCYLFDHACKPLIKDYVNSLSSMTIGNPFLDNSSFDSNQLNTINNKIKSHSIEIIGKKLRTSMIEMKNIV